MAGESAVRRATPVASERSTPTDSRPIPSPPMSGNACWPMRCERPASWQTPRKRNSARCFRPSGNCCHERTTGIPRSEIVEKYLRERARGRACPERREGAALATRTSTLPMTWPNGPELDGGVAALTIFHTPVRNMRPKRQRRKPSNRYPTHRCRHSSATPSALR